ncbi:hypothetical protein [Brevibacillus borstelensis]|uniref:hypothetical protein n=1 Tax=Brevibacillus borstelensis TaxID=45462 RepID=UPI0030BE07F8
MFHPLIFDNIKVVLEGAVYDRDFDGSITIIGRSDIMDMAAFYRQFQIEFRLSDESGEGQGPFAQMQLRTSLADIAAEQLEQPLTEHIGCTVCIHFFITITDVQRETEAVTRMLNDIWGNRPHIAQTIKAKLDEYQLHWPPEQYENQITLDFHRKIDEGNIEDLRDLVDHTIASLTQLHAHFGKRS